MKNNVLRLANHSVCYGNYIYSLVYKFIFEKYSRIPQESSGTKIGFLVRVFSSSAPRPQM